MSTVRTVIHGAEEIRSWVAMDAPVAFETCDLDDVDLALHERLVLRVAINEDGQTIDGYTVLACDRRPRTWYMHARHVFSGARNRMEFHGVGSATYARLGGSGREPVEVVVVEDPDGPYWAWVGYAGTPPTDLLPSMVRPTEELFRVQSDDGFASAVNRGQGEVMRLRIEKAG